MDEKLLFDSEPLVIIPELAVKVGLNEAIILQQIHYWVIKNKVKGINFRDGYYWTYNSYNEWHENFPFWSERTIRRTINKLEKLGLIVSANYNPLSIDRTKWYRINYDRLYSLEMPLKKKKSEKPIRSDCPDGKVNLTKPIPENSTEISLNPYMGIDKIDSKYMGIPNQQSQTSNTLVAEVSQIYPFNQTNKRVRNSEVSISFTDYYETHKVDPDVIKAITYYLEKYKEHLGKNHPRLKAHQWDKVTQSILKSEEDDIHGFYNYSLDAIIAMIDRHFLTSYKTGEYNILHFCSYKIREYRYKEIERIPEG